ncbi:hypothetical protein BX281_0424 [Streptomyces sp. Ag82_O1-15]|uniref:hypothetical protein n=1 Tax=Streptomyces sp. Ag82_O1-15 TaxID=1938855 RepID=UPI000BB128DE|nr:hypothetical protein [Streptomyces sp. Ag82_O1-15]PBC92733.1 hypothetical protein BX281_0424 [Streptomyces sp. Ag82_O1-15]
MTSTGSANTVTMRMPKGLYLLDNMFVNSSSTGEFGLVQPELNITKDTTVTLDARTAKSADITVPDAEAKMQSATVGYTYNSGAANAESGLSLGSFQQIRMAHRRPAVSSGLTQTWAGMWSKGDDAAYHVTTGGRTTKIAGERVRHYKASDLATVKTQFGASAPDKTGTLDVSGILPAGMVAPAGAEVKLPGARMLYVSTGDNIKWSLGFMQFGSDKAPGPNPVPEAWGALSNPQTLKADKSYQKTFNVGVFGPHIGGYYGIQREGNSHMGYVPMFTDGNEQPGSSQYTSVKSTLYRNVRRSPRGRTGSTRPATTRSRPARPRTR